MLFADLKGKTVVITGANRGIGKAIAEAFIKNQSRIVLIYKKDKPKFPHVLRTYTRPILVHSDINSIEKISKWLKDFEREKGKVDVLVNNAGILRVQTLLDVKQKDWDDIMTTNLKSMFFLSQIFARHMKRQKRGGAIINAASFAARIPSFRAGLYAVSKAAVVMLTRVMAGEWAPYNIRVNAYSPGVVETRMTRSSIRKNKQRMLDQIAARRFGKPQEIADGVLFLASQASSYLTGADLDLSGGKVLLQTPADPWMREE